jgi:hypothetical protein
MAVVPVCSLVVPQRCGCVFELLTVGVYPRRLGRGVVLARQTAAAPSAVTAV